MSVSKKIIVAVVALGVSGIAAWYFFGDKIVVDKQSSEAAGAILYVRAGATGSNNGSDWTNAYTELNRIAFSNGITVYVAAGTYNTGLPSTNTTVTVKRATVSEHGVDVGWQPAYDGQITVTVSAGKFWQVSGGGGTIDGVGSQAQGWKWRVVGQNSHNGKFLVENTTGFTIRGIEMDGAGCGSAEENGTEDGLRLGGNTNLLIDSVYVHDFWQCQFPGISNPGHADAIQMPSGNGVEVRYSVFKNSGMLLFFGDCVWGGQWANNIRVHHNLFVQQAGIANNYRIIDMKGAGRTANDYVKIENNTFVRMGGFSGATLAENTDCPANTTLRSIKNNIFSDGAFNLNSGWGTRSNNNYFGGDTSSNEAGVVKADPQFVNAAGLDFRLKSTSPARDVGANLGYTQDISGVSIPQNSGPDIGAHEFSTGSTPPPTGSSDLNSDGKVDVVDLGILLSSWGQTSKPKADINQNGAVDVVDLGILLGKWGTSG